MSYTKRKKIGLLLIAAGLILQQFGPHLVVSDFFQGLALGSGMLLVLLNDRLKSRFQSFKKRLRSAL